jgi:hypothetical protein
MDEYKQLDVDEVNQILRTVADDVLRSEKFFIEEKVDNWIEKIIIKSLEELKKMEKPHKFIVTCKINQRNGAEFYTHTSNFMDQEKDVLSSVHWSNDAMHCIITLLALWVY